MSNVASPIGTPFVADAQLDIIPAPASEEPDDTVVILGKYLSTFHHILLIVFSDFRVPDSDAVFERPLPFRDKLLDVVDIDEVNGPPSPETSPSTSPSPPTSPSPSSTLKLTTRRVRRRTSWDDDSDAEACDEDEATHTLPVVPGDARNDEQTKRTAEAKKAAKRKKKAGQKQKKREAKANTTKAKPITRGTPDEDEDEDELFLLLEMKDGLSPSCHPFLLC